MEHDLHNETLNVDRRALLAKLGRFGAYTAPALLVAMQSTKAAASSEDNGDHSHEGEGHNGHEGDGHEGDGHNGGGGDSNGGGGESHGGDNNGGDNGDHNKENNG